MLVARESQEGSLVESWEGVAGPGDVQTPRQVYEALRKEGLAVEYLRCARVGGDQGGLGGRRQRSGGAARCAPPSLPPLSILPLASYPPPPS